MPAAFADSLCGIRTLGGIVRADFVQGPDDCIAYVETEDKALLMQTNRAIRSAKDLGKTDSRSIAEI